MCSTDLFFYLTLSEIRPVHKAIKQVQKFIWRHSLQITHNGY